MLIVLIVATFLLALFSFFLFKKNPLSPSFLINAIFCVGSILAFVGNTIFWKEEITYKGPLLIICSLLLFVFGELVVKRFIFTKVKKQKETNEDKPIKEPFLTKYSILAIIVIFVLCLGVNAAFFKAEYDMAVEFGYSGKHFLTYARNALLSGKRIPIYITIPDFLVQGVGLVAIFLSIRQLFGGKKRFFFPYLILLIPLVISQFLSTGRNGFVLDVVIVLLSIYYFGVHVYKKLSLLEIFLISIIALNVFIFVFAGIGSIRNVAEKDFIQSLCIYGGSSIIALDKSLNISDLLPRGIFGSYTFDGFYGTFTKIFPSVNTPYTFLPNITFNNGKRTNVYTTFASFFVDFGLPGCLVLSLLAGFIFASLQILLIENRSTFSKLLYFYVCYSIVRSLFNSIFGTFLSVTEILQVFSITLFYFGFTYTSKVFKYFKTHKISGDIIYAFITQFVSLLLSITMSLVVPKILNVTEYSYWQLFMFYSTYVGIFHFGFIDGIYLRAGGKDQVDLQKNNLTSQFIIFTVSQFVLSGIACAIWCPLVGDVKRVYVILFTALYLIFSNLGLFFGYIFQAIGKVKIYSTSIFIEKALFLISIIVLLILKIDNGIIFISLYVLYRLVFFLYLFIMARSVVLAKPLFDKTSFTEIWQSTKRGFSLMLASLSSLLIMGVSRALMDSVWGLEAFGKFSFSISLCSFALAFLAQISMVFFPALRKVDMNQRIIMFVKMKKFALLVLPLSYFAYYILKILVAAWLPDYLESIAYIAFLMPICVYDGKMQMIMNTYFKVLNKEKPMLFVNLSALVISSTMSLLFAFVFKNMVGVIVSAVVGITIRCIVSDYYLSKLTKTPFLFNFILESAITIIFILTAILLPDWASFLCVLVVYVAILVLFRETIVKVVKKARIKINHLLQES